MNKEGEIEVHCPKCHAPVLNINIGEYDYWLFNCHYCGHIGRFRVDPGTGQFIIVTPENEWKAYRKKPIKVIARPVHEPEQVYTLEGIMQAQPGDYIVKGIENELYPVKRAIFEKTFEPV
jgi:hypothetical protein